MKDLASKGLNKMNNEENQSAEANSAATQTAAENPKAKWTDEQWFKVFRRASSVTARAGIGMGYQQINADHTVFTRQHGGHITMLAVYVNDMIITVMMRGRLHS